MAHRAVVKLETPQSVQPKPTGHTTLLQGWINVNDVDLTSQQRRVPGGKLPRREELENAWLAGMWHHASVASDCKSRDCICSNSQSQRKPRTNKAKSGGAATPHPITPVRTSARKLEMAEDWAWHPGNSGTDQKARGMRGSQGWHLICGRPRCLISRLTAALTN